MSQVYEAEPLGKATQRLGRGAGMQRPPWPHPLAFGECQKPPKGAMAGGGEKERDGTQGAVLRFWEKGASGNPARHPAPRKPNSTQIPQLRRPG